MPEIKNPHGTLAMELICAGTGKDIDADHIQQAFSQLRAREAYLRSTLDELRARIETLESRV